jgi:homoaconitate hydratase
VAAMSQEPSDTLTAKRFSHQRLDELFANPIIADKGAKYAKYLYLNLSTLSPYVSGTKFGQGGYSFGRIVGAELEDR